MNAKRDHKPLPEPDALRIVKARPADVSLSRGRGIKGEGEPFLPQGGSAVHKKKLTLAELTDEQQRQLATYGEQHTLQSTALWLKRKGVATDTEALAPFLAQHELKLHLERCTQAVDQVVAAMRKREPSLSNEDLRKFGQRFFVEAAIAGKDPRAWVALEQAASRREKLDRESEAQRAEKGNAGDDGIPPELFEQIERELRLL